MQVILRLEQILDDGNANIVSPDVHLEKEGIPRNWQQSICIARTQASLVDGSWNFYQIQLQIKLVNDEANLWAGTQSLPSPIVESGGVASEADGPAQI